MTGKAELTPSGPAILAVSVSIWPAIITTFLVGCGFAALKFVLIGRIALDFNVTTPGALDMLPWDWLRDVILAADQRGSLKDAISQAIAAVLTFGLIIAFPLNGPLAGAWRCNRLFAVSSAVVAGACMMTLWSNPWFWAAIVGIAYGASCAARGKVIPLLSHATGFSNTRISGGINAALAIGLLVGTVFGSWISGIPSLSPFDRHMLLLALSSCGIISALFIRVPEPPVVPMATGMRDFTKATISLCRTHWALLLGGGLAWGIITALSLALYVHAHETLGLSRPWAASLGLFGAVGAVLGNLISHWGTRRRWVIGAFILQAVAMYIYPMVVVGYWSSATMIICVSMLFAAPANVLDARFLANAHEDDLSGLGSTVMSLMHGVCILIISLSLAVPLFLGLMPAEAQFPVLAVISVLSCGVAAFANLSSAGSRTPK